ncbi:MAG: hypothetical protein ABJZ69_00525 [Hyphomicrobiales bacterium]
MPFITARSQRIILIDGIYAGDGLTIVTCVAVYQTYVQDCTTWQQRNKQKEILNVLSDQRYCPGF